MNKPITNPDLLEAKLRGQETERQRLSRDLHDDIGPILSVIRLRLADLGERLDSEGSNLLDRLRKIEEMMQLLNDQIRAVFSDLSPNWPSESKLSDVVADLCRRFNEVYHGEIKFERHEAIDEVESHLIRPLFRVVQELLNNGIKHSKARKIRVRLHREGQALQLQVIDDGIGFNDRSLDQLMKKGHGLQNVRNRVALLGGTYQLESQPGKGLFVNIEIPISKTEDNG